MGGLSTCLSHIQVGIDVYSSSSLRSDRDEAKFEQLFPLQVPHAAKQSIPCFFFCINNSGSHRQIHITIAPNNL